MEGNGKCSLKDNSTMNETWAQMVAKGIDSAHIRDPTNTHFHLLLSNVMFFPCIWRRPF